MTTNVEWAKEVLVKLEDKSQNAEHILLDLMSKVHKDGFKAGFQHAISVAQAIEEDGVITSA